jgi:AraC family transcriptional regulator
MTAAASDARVSAANSFTVERRIDFAAGRVEVRDYAWRQPTWDEWSFEAYFIHLCLTPRPGPASAAFLQGGLDRPQTLGRIMFVPPGHKVRSGGAEGRQRSLQCMLSPQMIDGLLPRRPRWDSAALAEGLRLTGPEIEWTLLRIYRELRQDAFAAEIMVEALARGLSVALMRRLGLDLRTAAPKAGGLAPWRMRLIQERANADLPAPSLADLAQLSGMSVRHLCRAFKAETGQTLAKFVEQAMIERARRLLATSEAVADVARAAGFSTPASFAYAFRRATGLRPSDVGGRRRDRGA